MMSEEYPLTTDFTQTQPKGGLRLWLRLCAKIQEQAAEMFFRLEEILTKEMPPITDH